MDTTKHTSNHTIHFLSYVSILIIIVNNQQFVAHKQVSCTHIPDTKTRITCKNFTHVVGYKQQSVGGRAFFLVRQQVF